MPSSSPAPSRTQGEREVYSGLPLAERTRERRERSGNLQDFSGWTGGIGWGKEELEQPLMDTHLRQGYGGQAGWTQMGKDRGGGIL